MLIYFWIIFYRELLLHIWSWLSWKYFQEKHNPVLNHLTTSLYSSHTSGIGNTCITIDQLSLFFFHLHRGWFFFLNCRLVGACILVVYSALLYGTYVPDWQFTVTDSDSVYYGRNFTVSSLWPSNLFSNYWSHWFFLLSFQLNSPTFCFNDRVFKINGLMNLDTIQRQFSLDIYWNGFLAKD